MIRTIAPLFGIVHFNRDSRVFRFNMKSIRIAAAAKAALKDNSVQMNLLRVDLEITKVRFASTNHVLHKKRIYIPIRTKRKEYLLR